MGYTANFVKYKGKDLFIERDHYFYILHLDNKKYETEWAVKISRHGRTLAFDRPDTGEVDYSYLNIQYNPPSPMERSFVNETLFELMLKHL